MGYFCSLISESDGNTVDMNIFNPLWLDMESEFERCLVWFRGKNQWLKEEFGVKKFYFQT